MRLPVIGPTTVPRAHIAEIREKYWPRMASGTISVTTISVRQMTPPPPVPWILRPTSMRVKLSASAAMIAPARKRARLMKMRGFRPKIWLNEPMTGCHTVDVSRKDVPAQNASMPLPWRAFAIIYSQLVFG